ncbi:RICIN domain-containing protein [uncultured Draconibacterium sp.]|uniref:RICIN domain-containing protein n=1 Tax=uncultured Draconibacterium sp. TaxID=1573823 RepID=UPI003216421F
MKNLLVLGIFTYRSILIVFLLLTGVLCEAQPGSHDPSSIAKDGDTYWIFNTNRGIGTVKASDPEFSDWQIGATVFGDTWPSWINNYVPDFAGHFWAPSIKYFNGKFHLYYSCSTMGAYTSAIGLATTTSLNNPNWEDQGMVVYSNSPGNYNAIDPAIFIDDDGSIWMTYGSWHAGIAITQIDPSTGKPTGNITHVTGGNAASYEGPYLIKHEGYYYMFVNRALCCQGVNSTYYIIVGRATSATGPYENWRTFKSTQGRYIGPGHIGYGQNRLTYHYYDGNEGGIAKLANTTLEWNDGWPVAAPPSNGEIVQLRNRATGMYLDGTGRTSEGELLLQNANTTDDNASWEISFIEENYQFANVATGMIISGNGDETNGAACIQSSNTSDINAQWEVEYYSGHFYRIKNAGTGMFLDGYGRTEDGSECAQYANTTHVNAQWEIISVGSGIVSDNRYRINPRSGNSLETSVSGVNMQIGSYRGDENQQFIITRVDNGFYRISPVSAPSMAMEVSNRSVDNGANIGLSSYSDSNNQKWEIRENGDGYYSVINVNSSKSLDVYLAVGNVIQYSYWKGTNQQFEFVDLGTTTTGLSNFVSDPEELVVYPNPTRNDITVRTKLKNDSQVNITICNMHGQKVLDITMGMIKAGQFEKNIKLDNFLQGEYIIQVRTDNGCQNTLLIKNK